MNTGPDEMRVKLRAAVETLPKPVRFRAINAMDGFDKALALIEIDREMASFRAITAQEEAAAALFNALKIRNYPGAERLNVGNHRHKWALWPVIDAARMAIGKGFQGKLDFRFTVNPAKFEISTPLSRISTDHPPELDDHRVSLADPLNMLHRIGGAPNLFAAELAEIAEANGHEDITELLAVITNQRNKLLYASDAAVPHSKVTAAELASRRKHGDTALYLAIVILQTRMLQAYAMQALEALLILVAKADALEMPYPDPDLDALRLRPPPADAADPADPAD